MTIEGVKVIVEPSGNEIVQVQTFIKGGVQNYGSDQQGIENLAMTALAECGTMKDNKNSFKDKLDKVDAGVYGTTSMDYSTLTLSCIKNDFDVVWPLYADALTIPLFDEKEFDRIRQDAITNLKSRSSQPDYSIRKMARETAFAGRDYAKTPEGNETTLSKLTVAQTRTYYTSILTRARLLIVVVGEIDRQVLERNIRAMLSLIPAGKPFSAKRESYSPKQNSFKEERKDLATNYVQGVAGAPLPGSPDFNAFSLAMRIFSQRHFLEIRTNNGLSYTPQAFFDEGLSPSANIVVSTKDPDKYITVLSALIDKTRKNGFTEEELKNMKTIFITGFYYQQETNGAQASSLAMNEILHNNWRRSLSLNDDIKKVTLQEVNKAFDKYITHMTWVYQGDTTKVDPASYIKGNLKLPSSTLNNPKNN